MCSPIIPSPCQAHPGFQALLGLVDSGRCWVKLSAAYMMSKSGPPLYADIGMLAKELVKRAPERLVWASNWPHPLSRGGAMPDDAELLDLLLDWAPQPQSDTCDEPRGTLRVCRMQKPEGGRMKSQRSVSMRQRIAVLAVGALAGCGVDTATTAATGAAIKKQEAEQGKKTQEQAQQKIDRAMDQTQQRARQDAGSDAR